MAGETKRTYAAKELDVESNQQEKGPAREKFNEKALKGSPEHFQNVSLESQTINTGAKFVEKERDNTQQREAVIRPQQAGKIDFKSLQNRSKFTSDRTWPSGKGSPQSPSGKSRNRDKGKRSGKGERGNPQQLYRLSITNPRSNPTIGIAYPQQKVSPPKKLEASRGPVSGSYRFHVPSIPEREAELQQEELNYNRCFQEGSSNLTSPSYTSQPVGSAAGGPAHQHPPPTTPQQQPGQLETSNTQPVSQILFSEFQLSGADMWQSPDRTFSNSSFGVPSQKPNNGMEVNKPNGFVPLSFQYGYPLLDEAASDSFSCDQNQQSQDFIEASLGQNQVPQSSFSFQSSGEEHDVVQSSTQFSNEQTEDRPPYSLHSKPPQYVQTHGIPSSVHCTRTMGEDVGSESTSPVNSVSDDSQNSKVPPPQFYHQHQGKASSDTLNSNQHHYHSEISRTLHYNQERAKENILSFSSNIKHSKPNMESGKGCMDSYGLNKNGEIMPESEPKVDAKDDPMKLMLPSAPLPDLEMEDAKLDSLITEALNGLGYQSDNAEIDSSFIDAFVDDEITTAKCSSNRQTLKSKDSVVFESRSKHEFTSSEKSLTQGKYSFDSDLDCLASESKHADIVHKERNQDSEPHEKSTKEEISLIKRECTTDSEWVKETRKSDKIPEESEHGPRSPTPQRPVVRDGKRKRANGGSWSKELIHKIVQQKNKLHKLHVKGTKNMQFSLVMERVTPTIQNPTFREYDYVSDSDEDCEPVKIASQGRLSQSIRCKYTYTKECKGKIRADRNREKTSGHQRVRRRSSRSSTSSEISTSVSISSESISSPKSIDRTDSDCEKRMEIRKKDQDSCEQDRSPQRILKGSSTSLALTFTKNTKHYSTDKILLSELKDSYTSSKCSNVISTSEETASEHTLTKSTVSLSRFKTTRVEVEEQMDHYGCEIGIAAGTEEPTPLSKEYKDYIKASTHIRRPGVTVNPVKTKNDKETNHLCKMKGGSNDFSKEQSLHKKKEDQKSHQDSESSQATIQNISDVSSAKETKTSSKHEQSLMKSPLSFDTSSMFGDLTVSGFDNNLYSDIQLTKEGFGPIETTADKKELFESSFSPLLEQRDWSLIDVTPELPDEISQYKEDSDITNDKKANFNHVPFTLPEKIIDYHPNINNCVSEDELEIKRIVTELESQLQTAKPSPLDNEAPKHLTMTNQNDKFSYVSPTNHLRGENTTLPDMAQLSKIPQDDLSACHVPLQSIDYMDLHINLLRKADAENEGRQISPFKLDAIAPRHSMPSIQEEPHAVSISLTNVLNPIMEQCTKQSDIKFSPKKSSAQNAVQGKFQCEICLLYFRTVPGLKRHKAMKHTVKVDKDLKDSIGMPDPVVLPHLNTDGVPVQNGDQKPSVFEATANESDASKSINNFPTMAQPECHKSPKKQNPTNSSSCEEVKATEEHQLMESACADEQETAAMFTKLPELYNNGAEEEDATTKAESCTMPETVENNGQANPVICREYTDTKEFLDMKEICDPCEDPAVAIKYPDLKTLFDDESTFSQLFPRNDDMKRKKCARVYGKSNKKQKQMPSLISDYTGPNMFLDKNEENKDKTDNMFASKLNEHCEYETISLDDAKMLEMCHKSTLKSSAENSVPIDAITDHQPHYEDTPELPEIQFFEPGRDISLVEDIASNNTEIKEPEKSPKKPTERKSRKRIETGLKPKDKQYKCKVCFTWFLTLDVWMYNEHLREHATQFARKGQSQSSLLDMPGCLMQENAVKNFISSIMQHRSNKSGRGENGKSSKEERKASADVPCVEQKSSDVCESPTAKTKEAKELKDHLKNEHEEVDELDSKHTTLYT
ncbi:hypothetical protein NFI96_009784 [Prochilodus magdalenae]|nr:hypothetical protein NFI96_009784 [Prochilodus magdalenae]